MKSLLSNKFKSPVLVSLSCLPIFADKLAVLFVDSNESITSTPSGIVGLPVKLAYGIDISAVPSKLIPAIFLGVASFDAELAAPLGVEAPA